jgi:hypothetical protein
MNKQQPVHPKFWSKNRLILVGFLIFMHTVPIGLKAQLQQSYFLRRSALNAYFYPLEKSYYIDISTILSSEKLSQGFQQHQANVYLPFSTKKMGISASLIRENHFLIHQNFIQIAYLYEIAIKKNANLQFNLSLNHSHQSIDQDELIFPSTLENLSNVSSGYLRFFEGGSFSALNSGIRLKTQNTEIKALWRNIAIIQQKMGMLNNQKDYYFEISQKKKLKNRNYQNNSIQAFLGFQEYADQKIVLSGLRWMNNRYFTEIQTEWIEFLPQIVTMSVGISIGNTIFAYQNTSTLNSALWSKGSNNGIKIAFELKKYKKSEDRHAISCPQF